MNRLLKKSISALLSIVLLLSLLSPQVMNAANGPSNTQLDSMIESTVNYYKEYYEQDPTSTIDSWWKLVALWGAGQNLQDGTWNLPSWETKEPRLKPDAVSQTDHIRYIFSLLAMGKDPAHAWETDRNLWAELATHQNQETGGIGSVNKHIWAMLAMDAGEKLGQDVGTWNAASKQKALQFLLKAQYVDGGFGLSASGGTNSDTDMTGMALLALGQYKGQSEVDAAIERAKKVLKDRQLDNGGFNGSYGAGDNSNSLSTSVSGLVAVGEDMMSPAWQMNGNTVVDAYAGFQLDNGSFKWKVTDIYENGMSTEQALLGLVDIQHGESVWHRIAEANQNSKVNVQVSVQGIDNPIYNSSLITLAANGQPWMALDALKQALDQANPPIDYNITGDGSQARVTSIAGQDEGTLGGSDGWAYKVNDSAPPVSVGAYEIKNGDDLYFYYDRQPVISSASSIEQGTVDPSIKVQLVGDTFSAEAEQVDSWSVTSETAGLKLKSVSLLTNQQVELVFDGQAAPGLISVQALAAATAGKEVSNEVIVSVNEVPDPNDDQTIVIDENETHVSIGSDQDPLSSRKVTLVFPKIELPHVTSATDSTYLEIEPNTNVISAWDNKLELPYRLNTNDDLLLNKINEALSSANKEVEGIDQRVKVGGDQDIRFNQHVTLTLKGQGHAEAGFIDASGAFTQIPKYEDSSARSDEVYAYVHDGDLIIKTKHFTEFVAYTVQDKGTSGGDNGSGNGNGGGTGSGGDNGSGNGGGVVPPITKTITLSVDKRSIGEGDIIAPVSVTIQDGDTAFTALKRAVDQRGISIDYIGSGASLYVQAIDGLGEFDKGPQSGWMYTVNGTFPNYSAGLYTLNNGDTLRWKYTTNLGEDINGGFNGGTGQPGIPGQPGQPGAPGTTGGNQIEESAKLQGLINGSAAWILNNRKFSVQDNFNDWDVMALARSGKQVPSAYYTVLESYVKEKKGEFRLVTDYERMALAVMAIGKDPSNIAGYNFLEKIYNHERMKNQGTNGLVFAMLALDASKATIPSDALWTRDKLVQQILDQQNSDGGFPISKESNAVSDIDMTAMALQALAKYQDRKEVKAATDKALTWLSAQQLPNGGFKVSGVETSESISQVIIALSSLGNSLRDKRFVKQDGDLLKALHTYLNKDGGFAHGRGEASNYMATQQATLALAAYDRLLNNHNSLFDMTDVKSAGTSKPETPAHPFTDEASIAAWAKEAVNKAAELGLMQGTGGETARFEPKRELTRAEFAALVVRNAGLEPKGTNTGFKDVDAKSWYAGYVAIAKEKGLISGVTADTFAPNQAITRQEMATVLVRLNGLPNNTDTSADLKDQQQVSAWALPYVNYAYQTGLMSGDDGYFRPQQQVTREMAAVVIVKLHDIQ
ncbi:S-layer homology domain-containing protein [Paenibacillus selenitireducens]|nr:S-layer homology domain-containing protein [Paenibacillus selenitireducens]